MLPVLVQVKLMKQQMVRQAPLPTLLASGSIWVACPAARFQDARPVKENQMENAMESTNRVRRRVHMEFRVQTLCFMAWDPGVVISFAFSGVRQEFN